MKNLFNNNITKVHFVGIGGISMSALAKYLALNGYTVSGSDKKTGDSCNFLHKYGITVFNGHNAENVFGKDVVVYNSAIDNGNPEILYAKEKGIPVLKRSELLKMLSSTYKTKIGVSGSHGKTTVTALCAHVLNYAEAEFCVHIGGFDVDFENMFFRGENNNVFLSEVCEYKRNIKDFIPDIAIVLNIDNDHMDSYGTIENLRNEFFDFLSRAEIKIINNDDRLLSSYGHNALTFGKNADYSVTDLSETNGFYTFTVNEYGKKLFKISPYLIGLQGVQNVLAVTAICRAMKFEPDIILGGINDFKGIKRRNECIGSLNGAKVFADYAHHPSEILRSVEGYNKRQIDGSLYIVFQPHTYSRTRILFDDFINVLSTNENVYIYKTYAAREEYDYQGSAKRLSEHIKNSIYFENVNMLLDELKRFLKPCDTLLVLGAGDLYDILKEKLNDVK